jgi:tRNA(Ile)-lysidine synthase TilS/MesJ
VKTVAEIEKSLITKFRPTIWTKFAKAVTEYKLINEGDKIAVCISGGKDSFLMAKCFQELVKHGKQNFTCEYLVMDPGYNPLNRKAVEDNAKILGVPIRIFESNVFDVAASQTESPCYLCARMRRGFLYAKAQELGCNKIALGHHFDDVAETILMGILYNGQIQTMMPRLNSKNFEGMQLIRPMYRVEEEAVKQWRNFNELSFIQCACRFTETCSVCGGEGGDSKRFEIKALIKNLCQNNPQAAQNIFNSVYNVNLEAIIGYRKGGERKYFWEDGF